MSTKVANGSGSNRSKESSSTKRASRSQSAPSKALSKSKSVGNSRRAEDSTNSANTSRQYTPSEQLLSYLDDTEHSNMGYSSAYTNALTNTYGFPTEQEARRDMEGAMRTESEARALARINEQEMRMEGGGRQG